MLGRQNFDAGATQLLCRSRNCKKNHFTSWIGQERQRNVQKRKTFSILKYRKFVTISLSSKSIVATIEITHALVPELTRSWSIYLLALILRGAMHLSERYIVLLLHHLQLKETSYQYPSFLASEFLQHNVIALVKGNNTRIPACTVATIINIPLINLHGNYPTLNRCAKVIQLSADFKDYAHASLDIIYTFHWKNIALVADGKEH